MLEYLANYTDKQPIIQQITLTKNTTYIGKKGCNDVYKVVTEVEILDEERGKEIKKKDTFFVKARDIDDSIVITRNRYSEYKVNIISSSITNIIEAITK